MFKSLAQITVRVYLLLKWPSACAADPGALYPRAEASGALDKMATDDDEDDDDVRAPSRRWTST